MLSEAFWAEHSKHIQLKGQPRLSAAHTKHHNCSQEMTWRLSRFKEVPSHAETIRVLIPAIARVAQAHSSLSATSPTCDITPLFHPLETMWRELPVLKAPELRRIEEKQSA